MLSCGSIAETVSSATGMSAREMSIRGMSVRGTTRHFKRKR